MSKLDLIVLDCVNKALDGNEEKLGDYTDPTKQEIKDLIFELAVANSYSDQMHDQVIDFDNFVKKLREL